MPVGALDARFKAIVAMVPFILGEVDIANFPAGYLAAALEERGTLPAASDHTRVQRYVPIFEATSVADAALPLAHKDAVIGGDAARSFYEKCLRRSNAAGTPWPIVISLQTLSHMAMWEPTVWIHQIAFKSLLYVVAEHDAFIPIAHQRAAFEKAGEPKTWISLDSKHLGTYMDDVFEVNVVKQIEWLRQWV